ncbi:MAG: glucose-1-phosphate cytidylyltransferase [Magnetococcales bacterium]|nr:glucose-1-phosphate cytidylyltransferase [Magnetococcales bacterium]
MKAVILAGGYGTRISEETLYKPKPMVEIGRHPILWHIMKMYSAHGINEFVICLGYRGYVIKEYFANYFLHMSDVTFDMEHNRMEVHERYAEPWRVTLVDTGESTMTGGRVRRILPYVKDEEHFCLTYGDGLADVDISALLRFHREQNTIGTVTAVQIPGRFGRLKIVKNKAKDFLEKPVGEGGWINGGFMVFSPKMIEYIDGDDTTLEHGPMERLARSGQLSAFQHEGFWQPMDTARDKGFLEGLWASGQAPWKVWQ